MGCPSKLQRDQGPSRLSLPGKVRSRMVTFPLKPLVPHNLQVSAIQFQERQTASKHEEKKTSGWNRTPGGTEVELPAGRRS